MKLFFTILFFLFPFGELLKIPVLGRISVLPQEIVIIIGFGLWLIANTKKIRQTPLLKEIGIFSGLALLSLLLSPLHLKFGELLEALLYLVRFLLYYAVFVMAYWGFNKNGIDKNFLIKGLTASVFSTGILGFLQLLFYPTLLNVAYLGWDIHNGRLVSSFLDPGFTGLIFVLGILLLMHSVILGSAKGDSRIDSGRVSLARMTSKKIINWIGLLFLLLCLVLTFSRSSYLALFAGLSVYAWIKNKFKVLGLVFVIILFLVILVPKPAGEGGNLLRTVSSLARLGDWQSSLVIWEKSPVLGVGFNAYRFARARYNFVPPNRPEVNNVLINHSLSGADNSFLLILATTGIIGFLAFLNMGRKIILLTKKNVIVVISLTALTVHTLFQNSLFYPFIMEWFWIIAATGL